MSELIKLKPCPFCGKGFRINARGAYEHDNETCILHGFEIRNYKGIKAWNTRKPIDEAEEVLKKCADDYKDSPDQYEQGKAFAYNNAINIIRGGAVNDT